MAKTTFASGTTAAHTFYIKDLDGASYTPITFHVFDWSVQYVALDAYQPGLVPSTCRLEVLVGARDSATGPLYDLMADSTGRYVIEIQKAGPLDVWRGFIQPELCSVELINGQRVLRLEAADGFAYLDVPTSRLASGGVASGLVPFTDQIADIFSYFRFFDLYRNFVVSAVMRGVTENGTSAQPTGGEGLYYSGCIMENWQYTLTNSQKNFRTCREVLDDICTSFGLQMFQVQGYVAFRAIYDDNPASWFEYDFQGDQVSTVMLGGTTTIAAIAGGLEMNKAAVREWWVEHAILSPQIVGIDSVPARRQEDWVGQAIPTGSNYLKYWLDVDFTVTVPANYGTHNVTFQVDYTWQFGAYYWNGTAWTLTPSYVSHNFTDSISNPDPIIIEVNVVESVANNNSMTTLPNIGPNAVYLTVEITRTAGPALTIDTQNATYKLEYNAASGDNLLYLVDNKSKRIGERRDSTTLLGDKYVNNPSITPTANELRIYTNTGRTTNVGNALWGDDKHPLIYAVYYELVSKLAVPRQYYEIETVAQVFDYSRRINFGGVYYRMVNLTIEEDRSQTTLLQIATDEPTP